MTATLNGQQILIIGGAKHLGEALARAAAARGARVTIGARDLERARAIAAELDGAEALHLDLGDEETISAAARALGTVDHVVITASSHHNVPVSDLEHDRIVGAFEAKVVGPLLVAKHFAPIIARTGSILLFSGAAAWSPSPGLAVMGVTNGAVSFLASHLAAELAPVRVNAVSPGVTDSGTWDGLDAESRKGMYEGAAAGSLAGRVGRPEDVVDAALWLLGASYVSGETIHVDGGSRHS